MAVVKLPPLPALSIKKIFATKAKLDEVLIGEHGYKYVGCEFTSFVHRIHDVVPGIPFDTLYQSLMPLAGLDILNPETDEIAWRLAGNYHHLREGKIIPAYQLQLFQEWAPMQIYAMDRCIANMKKNKDSEVRVKRRAVNVKILVLGGLPTGKMIDKFWPEDFFMRQETKLLFGFSRFDRRIYKRDVTEAKCYPLSNAMEYVKTRFYGLLDPELCKVGPNFEKIKCSPTFLKHNHELSLRRQRETFQCMMEYDVGNRPCHLCEIGYDQCSAGCHPATYLELDCSRCHEPNRYVDPTRSPDVCVDCLNNSKKD